MFTRTPIRLAGWRYLRRLRLLPRPNLAGLPPELGRFSIRVTRELCLLLRRFMVQVMLEQHARARWRARVRKWYRLRLRFRVQTAVEVRG